jgi:hypothetical protein
MKKRPIVIDVLIAGILLAAVALQIAFPRKSPDYDCALLTASLYGEGRVLEITISGRDAPMSVKTEDNKYSAREPTYFRVGPLGSQTVYVTCKKDGVVEYQRTITLSFQPGNHTVISAVISENDPTPTGGYFGPRIKYIQVPRIGGAAGPSLWIDVQDENYAEKGMYDQRHVRCSGAAEGALRHAGFRCADNANTRSLWIDIPRGESVTSTLLRVQELAHVHATAIALFVY